MGKPVGLIEAGDRSNAFKRLSSASEARLGLIEASPRRGSPS